MRKAKDVRGWTDDGRRYALNTLERLRDAGELPDAVLRQSVERGWRGLFPVKKDQPNSGAVPEWWSSESATNEQAQRLGMTSRGGESWQDFRGRIRERLKTAH